MNLEGRCPVYAVGMEVSSDEWYSKHGRLNDTNTTLKGVITSSMAAPIDDIKSWLVDKLVVKKISRNMLQMHALSSQDITSVDIFITNDFLKQIGISSLGVRYAILDIYENERSMLGHNSDDKAPFDKKSYAEQN